MGKTSETGSGALNRDMTALSWGWRFLHYKVEMVSNRVEKALVTEEKHHGDEGPSVSGD